LSYCVTAKDGVDVMIAANGQRPFEALSKLIGRDDLVADKRFLTPQDRNRNKMELRAEIDKGCLNVTSGEIIACLHGLGAPAAVINSIDRAFDEPQVLHRDMLLELHGEAAGDRARVAGNPIKLTEAPRTRYDYPPHAGEHTRAVLKELCGYDDAAIDTLLTAGAVLDAPVAERTQEF
jgi:crotonobetainyl-CoA:carnitine CoA-transferase CaiB-like acyl-CoA transferase